MFKKFFGFISNKIKGFVNKIRKSKTVKTVAKILGLAGSACVVITAFRMGNIQEAVRTMTKSEVGIIDTAGWFITMCKEMVPELLNKNITWGVRNFLIPFIGAIAYCGSKIMRLIRNFIRWIKTHKVISTEPKVVTVKRKPSAEVVNVF